ncbi:Arginine ABC transporter [Klebsiella pneumoniae]|nr:Arginine ABC transporter [Klebsiella pneumoniae]
MNEIFPLASAAGMTVGLAVCALVIGLVLAMLFAVLESVKWRPVAWLATGIVTILRGLPEILVVLFIYFGSSQLLLTLSDGFTIPLGFTQIPVQMQIENFDVSPFLCGAIALSLLYAAYASQTLRGALKAVPQGQWESGQALGLSKAAIFFRLVMPQMWRHALPGLGNQWLVLLKDTALVSLISVNDLMLQTKSIATRTQEPFNWYIIAAAIYLVITLLSQYILKRIDQRATRFERRPGLMLDYFTRTAERTAYQPDADRGVDYRGADPVADLHHYPDPEDAGAGMDSARLYHLVYRYAAAGADLPDLLRPGTVPFAAGVSVAVASYLRAVAVRPDRSVAQQRRLHHSAVLWRHPGDPRRAMAVLQRAGDE